MVCTASYSPTSSGMRCAQFDLMSSWSVFINCPQICSDIALLHATVAARIPSSVSYGAMHHCGKNRCHYCTASSYNYYIEGLEGLRVFCRGSRRLNAYNNVGRLLREQLLNRLAPCIAAGVRSDDAGAAVYRHHRMRDPTPHGRRGVYKAVQGARGRQEAGVRTATQQSSRLA